jgi:hypothetical protein
VRKILAISIFVLFVALFPSCRKDKLIKDSSAKLAFTTDSILFDTVFTSIGSTTKLFRVHNNNSGSINISSIRLGRGSASFYHLNVDGVAGQSFSNIEIAAHDSIYVFVKVTINPNADPSVSPFIYRDSVLFETNGNAQNVKLVAFGQNAYYHLPNKKIIVSNTQALYYSLDTNVNGPACHTWKVDKPHLIYGYLVVDSLHQLTIPAGARIYIHNNGGIWVYRGGCIQIKGEYKNEVTFQGDRLEADYKDLPGQWDRIWINEGSTGNCGGTHNIIDYAIIKNGFIGVQAGYSVLDGYGGNVIGGEPRNLSLTNTIIQNCSFAGLLAHYYNITGGNDVISNCGKYLCALQYGGNYSFTQCTFANYWSQTNNNSSGSQTRTTPSFFFNNYVGTTLFPDSTNFYNCILDGNLGEELQFDTIAGNITAPLILNYYYSLLKTGLLPATGTHTNSCLIDNPPTSNAPTHFVSPGTYDFHLNNLSSALNTGNSIYIGPWFNTIDGAGKPPYNMGAY